MSAAHRGENALLPLPSFLRASAHDAASTRMRKAGRTKWNEGDADAAVDTLDRLVVGCYGEGGRGRLRFTVAEQLERAGALSPCMTVEQLNGAIDQALCGEAPEPVGSA